MILQPMHLKQSPAAEAVEAIRDRAQARPGGIDERTSSALLGAAMLADGLPVDGITGTPIEKAIDYLRSEGFSEAQWPLSEIVALKGGPHDRA